MSVHCPKTLEVTKGLITEIVENKIFMQLQAAVLLEANNIGKTYIKSMMNELEQRLLYLRDVYVQTD